MKNRYCHHCGTPYLALVWPRECSNIYCERVEYDNPTPVVICVQPIVDRKNCRSGIAIAQRAQAPHISGWTLIGGHIENNGETVQMAGMREFNEETSVRLGDNAVLVDSHANNKGHLLLEIHADPIDYEYFLTGKPCHENLALDVMWEFRELAFPIHTEIVRKWFKKNTR